MERKRKYIIYGIIILVSSFLIYNFYNKYNNSKITTPINSVDNLDDFKRAIKKLTKMLDKDRKGNHLLLLEIKKLNKLNKLQIKYLKDIEKPIFGKNIEKHRFLIDTHNIPGITDRSSYVYYFRSSDSGTNETAGYTEIDNIIGFRLVKAIIPNTHHIITNTRNIVLLTLSNTVSTVSDQGKTIRITLRTGNYTAQQITNAFDPTLGATYEWFGESGDTPNSDLGTTYRISVSFNTTTKLFTFQMANSNEFKFVWDQISENSANTILGFNKEETGESNTQISTIPPDMSIHYVDLIIDEIPYIACKKNARGKKIIERIGLLESNGLLVEHTQSWNSEDENYFFPITLSKLTIELHESSHNHFYDATRDHTLEFEITRLKNPSKYNLIN